MASVTLITPYFWPEVTASVPLMTNLAADLVDSGHSVTVVTSLPSRNVDAQVREDFWSRRDTPETYYGASVIRYPNPFSNRKGALAKVLEGFVFAAWAMYATARLKRKTDVYFVYSNPPLLSLAVKVFAGGKPILYNLQDVFPDSALADGVLKEGMLARCLRFFERKSYECSALVAAIGESFSEHIARSAPDTLVRVVPNWVDTDSIRPVRPDHNSLLKSLGISDAFKVVYAGNMGFAQNLGVIVDAAEILQAHRDIRFILIGDGQHKEVIQDKIARLGLSNVIMLPMQPQELVPEVYSMGDVGIVTVRAGRERSSIPSKTWTIMACRSAVLACIGKDSELGKLITSERIGVVVPPDDVHQLAAAILQLHENDDLRRFLADRGRLYVERHISRKTITAVYSKIITELADGNH